MLVNNYWRIIKVIIIVSPISDFCFLGKFSNLRFFLTLFKVNYLLSNFSNYNLKITTVLQVTSLKLHILLVGPTLQLRGAFLLSKSSRKYFWTIVHSFPSPYVCTSLFEKLLIFMDSYPRKPHSIWLQGFWKSPEVQLWITSWNLCSIKGKKGYLNKTLKW